MVNRIILGLLFPSFGRWTTFNRVPVALLLVCDTAALVKLLYLRMTFCHSRREYNLVLRNISINYLVMVLNIELPITFWIGVPSRDQKRRSVFTCNIPECGLLGRQPQYFKSCIDPLWNSEGIFSIRICLWVKHRMSLLWYNI